MNSALGISIFTGSKVNASFNLLDNYMKASYHKMKFDALEFASGDYLYKIMTCDFVDTKKNLLLKLSIDESDNALTIFRI